MCGPLWSSPHSENMLEQNKKIFYYLLLCQKITCDLFEEVFKSPVLGILFEIRILTGLFLI